MTLSVLDKDRFLNVDLDIYSESDLQPLVTAMGDGVRVLFVGRIKRTYEAHLELSGGNPRSPECAILELCRFIRRLPIAARKQWNAAKRRSFDVGIGDTEKQNHYYWLAFTAETLRAVAGVNAQIAITVYGPMKVAKQPKKKRAAPAK